MDAIIRKEFLEKMNSIMWTSSKTRNTCIASEGLLTTMEHCSFDKKKDAPWSSFLKSHLILTVYSYGLPSLST